MPKAVDWTDRGVSTPALNPGPGFGRRVSLISVAAPSFRTGPCEFAKARSRRSSFEAATEAHETVPAIRGVHGFMAHSDVRLTSGYIRDTLDGTCRMLEIFAVDRQVLPDIGRNLLFGLLETG